MEPVVAPRTFSNRYEVTHLIARGGMAQVYRALDTRLGRHVALKVLFPELSVDRTFVERFRREAQAAANLSHPNIVAVYDWGEDEGTYFIVMELVAGNSLATALRTDKTIPATRAATIAAQVASALAYAHRHGVVHRDIKPGNVLLTDEGHVKVTDFGIAQAVSTEEGLTMAGSVMGTAAYFSPEQAEGALVDGRSDLYSLGVVLYEMLAGRPPFVGDSPVAVASMHVRNEPPRLRDLSPSVPEALERVTMHALAKSPDARYQTADEFREDLVRFTEGVPVLAAAGALGATSVLGQGTTTTVAAKDTTLVVPAVAQPVGQAAPLAVPPAAALLETPVSEEIRRKEATNRNTWIVLALILALVAVGAVAYVNLSGANNVTVPPLVGQTLHAAEQKLQADGLNYTARPQATVGYRPGIVIKTTPARGAQISGGSYVHLIYAVTPALVTVPAVQGRSLQYALNTLAAAHLVPKTTQVFTWTLPVIPDSVLHQSQPSGKSVPSGTIVTLTLLGSGGTFPLPSVIFDNPTVAGSTLGKYGLNTSQTISACSSTAVNLVSATNPAPNVPVSAGDTVTLTISSGPCPVQVPNVVSFTTSNAESAIHAAQLQATLAGCTSGPTSTNTVVSQSPQSPQKVTPGSTVVLTIGCVNGNSGTTGNVPLTGTIQHGNGHHDGHHGHRD